MVHEVEAVLLPDIHIEGSVCPGEWIYHKYEHVATGHRQDATFNLELHTGDLYYTLRPDRPAITLVSKICTHLWCCTNLLSLWTVRRHLCFSQTPPFHHTSAVEMARTQQAATGTECDIHNGTTQYLGLRGGHVCSDYYVWVSLAAHNSSCQRFSQQD